MTSLEATAVLGFACLTYYAPHAARFLGAHSLQRRCAEMRTLAITYDDGPSAELSPILLDLLAERAAHATFFLLSSRIQAETTAVVERIEREGHEIGSHGHAHPNAWVTAPWALLRDLRTAGRKLSALGLEPRLYRPPHGKLVLPNCVAARLARMRLGWWTHDSGDTRPTLPDPGDVVRAVRASGGGVVLLHDFERTPERRSFVVETTRQLLDLAREDGFAVETLGALLRRPAAGGSERAGRVMRC